MKTEVIALYLFLLIITGCDNPVEQEATKLQISFKNTSPFELHNLIVGEQLAGNLEVDTSSNYFFFEKFTFDTSLPDENASAVVNGQSLTNYYRNYWCGTEKITVDSGKYLIEISLADTMLFLSCKNAPRIDFP